MHWTYKWVFVLIGWVGPKVNELDLGSGLGSNRLGWAKGEWV